MEPEPELEPEPEPIEPEPERDYPIASYNLAFSNITKDQIIPYNDWDISQFQFLDDGYAIEGTNTNLKFVNLTNSGCKKAEPTNNYHGITLTKCYAEYEKKNKNLIKYLNGIF